MSWDYTTIRPGAKTGAATRARLEKSGYERYRSDHLGEHYRRRQEDLAEPTETEQKRSNEEVNDNG